MLIRSANCYKMSNYVLYLLLSVFSFHLFFPQPALTKDVLSKIDQGNEVVVLIEIVDGGEDQKKDEKPFTEQEKQDITEAKKTLKTFWVSVNKHDFNKLFSLFLLEKKQFLKPDINNGKEYFNKRLHFGLETFCQQYEIEEIYLRGNQCSIKILITWLGEGYSGVRTYFFTLKEEKGQWKILHIIW